MKAILRIGFLTVAAIFLVCQSVHAIQVTYSVNEAGGSGLIEGGAPFALNERVEAEIGTYQFTGSVLPDRVGLIGVSSGFRAVVSRLVPGFTPDGGGGPVGGGGGGGEEPNDGEIEFDDGPGDIPFTEWTNVTVDTSAAGTFQTAAAINGLSDTNDVGFVRFDWVITGQSSIFLDAGVFGDVTVNEAVSVATLRETGDLAIPDSFIHAPTRARSINDVESANLQAGSFLLAFDASQLNEGEVPLIPIDFEFAVSTRLNITNNDGLGNFEALFDADFSNTATLTSVTVLDANLNVIPGASVVDSVTGESLVAASVVEEEVSSQQCLADIAAEVGALADAATDSADAYALNVACAALNFAAKDRFFEEDGNRLTRRGGNVFIGAAYAISFLEHTSVEGTEDIVDRILDKLEQIVDDEIDYAIDNGGRPQFIERAEDLTEVAQWIDEDLDNPVVAAVVYKLSWANAFFATY